MRGIGRYDGFTYVVTDEQGNAILTLAHGVMIGHGSYSRRIEQDGDGFYLPGTKVASETLPSVRFLQGMSGFWQVGDRRSVVFSPTLPDGATEVIAQPPPRAETTPPAGYDPPAREATTPSLEGFDAFRTIKGPKRLVLFTATVSGRDVTYAPDPTAHVGTTERMLADLLAPGGAAAVTALRNRATSKVSYLDYLRDVMRTVVLNDSASAWLWREDGHEGHIEDYQPGDHTINLRDMVVSGLAVELATNSFAGEMVEVLGLTVLSDVAYAGRDGDPFQFVVPCEVGESRTIHVVVRHKTGMMVYGFTVAHRSIGKAREAAERAGEDRLKAMTRRPVSYSHKQERIYFVAADGQVMHIIPIP